MILQEARLTKDATMLKVELQSFRKPLFSHVGRPRGNVIMITHALAELRTMCNKPDNILGDPRTHIAVSSFSCNYLRGTISSIDIRYLFASCSAESDTFQLSYSQGESLELWTLEKRPI